ncbi:ATP synthase F1 subunit epsilon [Tautonia rosea]|uniref:ATP synthase F1 subunit epsilon n=1 Tax=Tautonia rosea TaxID=2728037 RepID=UPI001475EF09|nr:ATP synthase F1 subunit epsilon [Tautonia rosea]
MSTTAALIEPQEPFDTPPGNPVKKEHHGVRCLVVTPEATVLDDVAEFVALPLFDGELGVLPGRTPLIGRLGFGALRLRTGTLERRYFVDGGFAQVRDDVVTILTSRAMPVEKIDLNVAHQELDSAKSRKATSSLDLADKARAEGRARALIRLAETSKS